MEDDQELKGGIAMKPWPRGFLIANVDGKF